ncbi:MAG: DAK2 domain-containing protein, partial [Oscillospiraceae bacterium]|nr:DAK2 domain-containing protein [Oscillospiraceae bacterium]
MALKEGVAAAYKAVMKPTEGTILTVVRLCAEKIDEFVAENKDEAAVWDFVCKTAYDAVQSTPEMLPVLKTAGVVDAGGQGLYVIFSGMAEVLCNGKMVELEGGSPVAASTKKAGAASVEIDPNMTKLYCTEFIINRNDKSADPLKLRAFLESMGDSVVCVDDDDIIKVHVHTGDPGAALTEAVKWGYLTKLKIENMLEQHRALVAEGKDTSESEKPSFDVEEEFPYAEVDENEEYGFVAVAAGAGVKNLFLDLGVNAVVSGGQTMNPSTDDILKAIHSVPAKTVFVLPNNKNIIMAAEQTLPLADRKVVVLQTRTIPQGLSAMLSFDPDAELTANCVEMTKAIDHVGTGQITYAARDSEYEGHHIKEGQLMAMKNGKLSFTDDDLQATVWKLTKQLLKKDSSFVTLIVGEDVEDADSELIEQLVQSKLPDDVELAVVKGDQPVYYYIISVE